MLYYYHNKAGGIFMRSMLELASDLQVQEEYKTAYHLNLFEKFCKKMERQKSFKQSVLALYRQSFNVIETTKAIVQREFGAIVSDEEAKRLHSWIWAHFKKKPSRQTIPLSVKSNLYDLQKGRCNICKKELGKNWSLIHVDHYVPWTLVGDELENNLQLLCNVCNERKNDKTNYVFENLLGLN